jgi:hypothetical protein
VKNIGRISIRRETNRCCREEKRTLLKESSPLKMYIHPMIDHLYDRMGTDWVDLSLPETQELEKISPTCWETDWRAQRASRCVNYTLLLIWGRLLATQAPLKRTRQTTEIATDLTRASKIRCYGSFTGVDKTAQWWENAMNQCWWNKRHGGCTDLITPKGSGLSQLELMEVEILYITLQMMQCRPSLIDAPN